MIDQLDLTHFLNEHLAVDNFQDYAPNGLQVEGQDTVKRICTAVTASETVIKKATEHQADALLVHHGYFWKGENPTIKGMKRARLSLLLRHNINLYAYHLPLDCHPKLGNNACIGRLLNLSAVQQHDAHRTTGLLWSGELPKACTPAQLTETLTEVFQQPPALVTPHDKLIHRVAWCSGAAQDLIEQAHALGVDAYLSGEISERTYYQANELGIHYYACGHHATERYGIQALGDYLASKFDLAHTFIDEANPY